MRHLCQYDWLPIVSVHTNYKMEGEWIKVEALNMFQMESGKESVEGDLSQDQIHYTMA